MNAIEQLHLTMLARLPVELRDCYTNSLSDGMIDTVMEATDGTVGVRVPAEFADTAYVVRTFRHTGGTGANETGSTFIHTHNFDNFGDAMLCYHDMVYVENMDRDYASIEFLIRLGDVEIALESMHELEVSQ